MSTGTANGTLPTAYPEVPPREGVGTPSRGLGSPNEPDGPGDPGHKGRVTVVLDVPHSALIAEYVGRYYPHNYVPKPGDIVHELMDIAMELVRRDAEHAESPEARRARLVGAR